jgi:hypothetical protein
MHTANGMFCIIITSKERNEQNKVKEKRKKGKFGSSYTINRPAQTFRRLTTSVWIFKVGEKEGELFNKPNLVLSYRSLETDVQYSELYT